MCDGYVGVGILFVGPPWYFCGVWKIALKFLYTWLNISSKYYRHFFSCRLVHSQQSFGCILSYNYVAAYMIVCRQYFFLEDACFGIEYFDHMKRRAVKLNF